MAEKASLTPRMKARHIPETAKTVHRYPPHKVVELLRSAGGDPGDPTVAPLLECFRRRWLAWAAQRYPTFKAQHEDAVREAEILVLRRIDHLRDPVHVERWADSVFVIVLREVVGKHGTGTPWLRPGDDPNALRHRLPDVSLPREQRAILRELSDIVLSVARTCEDAWLKFEGLSEKELEKRAGRRSGAIAAVVQIQRISRVLQRILDETDEGEGPSPTSRILDGTRLPRQLRAELVRVIERLRRLTGDSPRHEDD